MIPAGHLGELFESRHRTVLPPPGTDALLQRRVVQLALTGEQPIQRCCLLRRRLQHRLKRTEHSSIMTSPCNTPSSFESPSVPEHELGNNRDKSSGEPCRREPDSSVGRLMRTPHPEEEP
jgi:hypothetical protein